MNEAGPNEAFAGLSILVVEDEVAIAMLLEEMLEDGGCTNVTLVPSIEAALASIGQRVFSGVLLDMNLHGMSSILVAEELARRSVPFVLVTGYGAQDSDPPLVQSAPRLQKPFTHDELMRVVRTTIAARP